MTTPFANHTPTFATPLGQPLATMRTPFFIVPDDGSIESLSACVAEPPTGDYVVTLDLRRIVDGKPAPFGASPFVFDSTTPPYKPVVFELEKHTLAAGDVLEVSVHVDHGGGKMQADVGSNLYKVEGQPGSGLLVQAVIA